MNLASVRKETHAALDLQLKNIVLADEYVAPKTFPRKFEEAKIQGVSENNCLYTFSFFHQIFMTISYLKYYFRINFKVESTSI